MKINNSMSVKNKFLIQVLFINTFKKNFKANKCDHVIAISGYAKLNVCKTIEVALN